MESDLVKRLREFLDWAIRKPNMEYAYSRCKVCDASWWDREKHRSDCLLLGAREAADALSRSRNEALEEAAHEASCYGASGIVTAAIRALKIAAPMFYGDPNRPIRPDWANYQQGRKDGAAEAVEVTDELVSRFLQWPVPESVYPDGVPGQPGRTGTNLLSAIEARAMLEHVLQGIALSPLAAPAESATVVVPREPTEIQWSGLARDIMMWLDMERKTPRALFDHLERIGTSIPQWLCDETEMKNLDSVPSKGTRCVIIYRAMLAAAQGEGK